MNYQFRNTKLLQTMFCYSPYETVDIKVKGYWNDSITIYFEREKEKFSARISVKSGGRDTNEVKDDTEAILYLAEALVVASNYAKDILAEQEILEAHFQSYLASLKK